jgi:hypothetical protein
VGWKKGLRRREKFDRRLHIQAVSITAKGGWHDRTIYASLLPCSWTRMSTSVSCGTTRGTWAQAFPERCDSAATQNVTRVRTNTGYRYKYRRLFRSSFHCNLLFCFISSHRSLFEHLASGLYCLCLILSHLLTPFAQPPRRSPPHQQALTPLPSLIPTPNPSSFNRQNVCEYCIPHHWSQPRYDHSLHLSHQISP